MNLNRRNITIVAISFAMAALAVFVLGQIRYSKPGAKENEFFNTWSAIRSNYNASVNERQKMIVFYQNWYFDKSKPYNDRQRAYYEVEKLLQDATSEKDPSQSWMDKCQKESQARFKSRSHFNLAAEVLAAISAAFILLLFITKPTIQPPPVTRID